MDFGTVTDKLLERNSKRLILMCMDTSLIIVSMILSRLFLDVCTFVNDVRPKKGDKKPLFVILSGASS